MGIDREQWAQGTLDAAWRRGKRVTAEDDNVPYFESDAVLSTIPEILMQETLQHYEHYKEQQRIKAVVEPDFDEKVKTRSKCLLELQEEEEEDDPSAEEDEGAAAGGTSRLSRKARWERHGKEVPP